MDSAQVVDLIHQALRQFQSDVIKEVSFDGDNHDCEIIITTEDDLGVQNWVVTSNTIRELESDEDET